jgi:hypothetical protein
MESRIPVAVNVASKVDAQFTKEQIIETVVQVARDKSLNGFDKINDAIVTAEEFTSQTSCSRRHSVVQIRGREEVPRGACQVEPRNTP